MDEKGDWVRCLWTDLQLRKWFFFQATLQQHQPNRITQSVRQLASCNGQTLKGRQFSIHGASAVRITSRSNCSCDWMSCNKDGKRRLFARHPNSALMTKKVLGKPHKTAACDVSSCLAVLHSIKATPPKIKASTMVNALSANITHLFLSVHKYREPTSLAKS